MTIMPAAEFQVRTDLLIDAVAKAENIEASAEEVEQYAKDFAERVNAKVEEVKSYFGEAYLAEEKKRQKATDLILESAVVGELPAAEPEEKAEEPAAEEKTEEKAEEEPKAE